MSTPNSGAKPVTPAHPDRIEDKLLSLAHHREAISGPHGPRIPRIYARFVEEMAPKLLIRPTSFSILHAFSNIDVTAQKIAQALRADPYYQHYFRRTIEAKARRRELPSLEAAVILLGMQHSRNLIVALQAWRSVTGRHPDFNPKTGEPQLKPREALEFALQVEELLADTRGSYSDTAYAAALLYDILFMMTEGMGDGRVRVQQYLKETFRHGLKSAKIATELSLHLPDFSFKKYIFSACILHDIGKVAMAILEPTYLDWLEMIKKHELPRSLRHYAERIRFGLTHAEFSGMICHASKVFRPIEKSVLHHHDPQRMKAYKNTYDLACLVSLSSNMATQFRKVNGPEDPVIAAWRGPELKDFKLSNQNIAATTLSRSL